MSETPLLGLPLLESNQAQKHVTHNEALLLLDAAIHLSVKSRALTAPPSPSPSSDGNRYLVAAPATGVWAGRDGQLAIVEASAWRFLAPRNGWRLWVEDEAKFLLFDGIDWRDLQDIDELSNMSLLGVNTTADADNRLAVASSAVLLSHAGSDHRLKINKQAAADTASLLMQTDYAGRAELGLAGDDDFHVKVSPDGSNWFDAVAIDRVTGSVRFPHSVSPSVIYTDKMAASLAAIPAPVNRIRLMFHSAATARGGAWYRRVAGEPVHDLKFQDALGAWWEIDETELCVTMAGAAGDGVTDDTQAQQRAFAYCSLTNRTLRYPPGIFLTTAKLSVTSGFRIVGTGEGADQSTATNPAYPCAIQWNGTNTGTDFIIEVKSPSAGNYVYGFHIDGVALKGANLAYGGLLFASARFCGWGNLWVDRCRVVHVQMDDSNAALLAFCHGDFLKMVAGTAAAALSARGLVIRGAVPAKGTTNIQINRIHSDMQNGDGVVIGDCDNSIFGQIKSGTNDGWYGLRFQGAGSDGNIRASRKNRVFWGSARVYAENGSKNILDWVNSEGTSVTVEPGASLHYGVIDRRNGRRFQSHAQVINDHLDLPWPHGVAHAGTPALGTSGAQAASGVLFGAAAAGSWQWTFRPPRSWHAGRITGFEIIGLPTANTGGNVVLELAARQRPLASGFGTALFAETFTAAVTAAVAQEKHVFTLAAPIAVYDTDGALLVRVSRLGADAADTFAADYMMIAVRLIFEANAADSDAPDYRYQPSGDAAAVT